jgi:hypothetical protein
MLFMADENTSKKPMFQFDKSQFGFADLEEQGNDLEYWLSRDPIERINAVEFLRQMMYGYDPATARVQRILEIVDLE